MGGYIVRFNLGKSENLNSPQNFPLAQSLGGVYLKIYLGKSENLNSPQNFTLDWSWGVHLTLVSICALVSIYLYICHCTGISLYFPIKLTISNGLSLTTLNSEEFTLCSGSFEWGDHHQFYPPGVNLKIWAYFKFLLLLHRALSFLIRNKRPISADIRNGNLENLHLSIHTLWPTGRWVVVNWLTVMLVSTWQFYIQICPPLVTIQKAVSKSFPQIPLFCKQIIYEGLSVSLLTCSSQLSKCDRDTWNHKITAIFFSLVFLPLFAFYFGKNKVQYIVNNWFPIF